MGRATVDLAAFEALGTLFIALDPDGRIVHGSRATLRFAGLTLEQLCSMSFWDLFHVSEDVAAARALAPGFRTAGTPPRSLRTHWITNGGDRHTIAWTASPRYSEAGELELVLLTGIDISAYEAVGRPSATSQPEAIEVRSVRSIGDRDELLAEVDDERRWLRTLVDAVPLALLLFELDGRLTFNRRAEEIFGRKLTPEGGRDQYREEVFYPDGTAVPPDRMPSARVLATGEYVRGEEYLVRRPDGTSLPLLGSAEPLLDANGKIVGCIAVLQDISERMRSEEAVRASERLFSTLFEILPVGVGIADMRGNVVRTNRACQRIWHGSYTGPLEEGSFKGWWADTGKPIENDDWAVARAIRTGATSVTELIRIQCFDGTFKTIFNSALPLNDEHGTRIGAIFVNEDITGLKDVEAELRRAVLARDDVLRIVAHDLRGPLSAMLLQLQLLHRRGAEPERRTQRPTDAIRRQAMRMNRLIQDLLDVVRIDSGSLAVTPARVGTVKLLTESVETQRPIASSASVTLRLETSRDLPDVFADRERLLQVLENLVGNALKFTPAGGTVVVGASAHGATVRFWVSDTGMGMAQSDLTHVFDHFWQANRTDRRGAGLGLSIVKGIVDAHQGRVWAESTRGVGSTFYFELPVATLP